MELLILLLERRGQLITREEIVARLWPNPDSIDIIQGINTAVNRIRAVLNDDAGKPRFIETVVGKGYRFIADLEELEIVPAPASTKESAPTLAGNLELKQEQPFEIASELPDSSTRPVHYRKNWLLVAFAAAALFVSSLTV